MIEWIDNFLNRITMYRLVFWYLFVLLGAAVVFSFFKLLPYDPAVIIFSAAIIAAVCWIVNRLFALIFHVPENVESIYITALILALIIEPVTSNDYAGLGFLVFVSAWAMASKYIFAIKKKHIFNPAAFGVALAAFTINQAATWWVGGNIALLPFVLIGGLLVVRKIQRFDLVAGFSVVSLATVALTARPGGALSSMWVTLLHSSFFFLAFVMLTEPLTSPPKRFQRLVYGGIVGFFFAPSIHIGSFYFTPELALLIGNIFSYLVGPKDRLILSLQSVAKIGTDAYEYIFAPDQRLAFEPGQYLEWTLGHRTPDNRGNRRYFTIASAPTEEAIHLGVKFYSPPSSFKRALAAMHPGDTIVASQLAGEFTLPKDSAQKLVFIAGGIGITPFRSMIQYLLDKHERRNIILIYSNKKTEDIAYRDILDRAGRELGIKTIYITSGEKSSHTTIGVSLSVPLIMEHIPDYRERTFYVSGPRGMVTSAESILFNAGVSRLKIKTDFFPGFA